MFEAILIVEGSSDVQTATKLAERVLLENIDWLEPELLENLFCWSGLESETSYSCWKDIKHIIAVLGGMRYVQRPVTLIQQGSSCTSFDQEPL